MNDEMIQNAHAYIHDTRLEDYEENCTLENYMDSFPLIPLPVIPRLCINDLHRCERALQCLIAEENDECRSTNEKHLQMYASRQLSLVQKYLIEKKAQERVKQLLGGQAKSMLRLSNQQGEMKQVSIDESKYAKLNSKSLAEPKTTTSTYDNSPVAVGKSYTTPPQMKKSMSEVPLRHPRSVQIIRRKRNLAVSKLSFSNPQQPTTTSFVIAATDIRQPRPLPRKRSPLSDEKKKQQLENSREARKNAAIRRLEARRALQAARYKNKKVIPLENNSGKVGGSHHNESNTERLNVGKLYYTQTGTEGSLVDEQSCNGGSDESDVSNCSESDEENERNIMNMNENCHDSAKLQIEYGMTTTDECLGKIGDNQPDTDYNRVGSNNAKLSEQKMDENVSGVSLSNNVGAIEDSAEENDAPIYDTGDGLEKEEPVVENAFKSANTLRDCDDEHESNKISSFKEELIEILSKRSASMLEQLIAEKQERLHRQMIQHDEDERDVRKSITHGRKLTLSHNEEKDTSQAKHEKEKSGTESSSSPAPINTARNSIHKKSTSVNSRSVLKLKLQDSICSSTTPHDYCKYFGSNFTSILTLAFERNGASNSNENIIAKGSAVLSLQLKLYESWVSIMHDYATVFSPQGVSAENDEGKVNGYAPHYRLGSNTRSELSSILQHTFNSINENFPECPWAAHASGLGLKSTWNLLWTWSKPTVERSTLLTWQKVNHFKGASALTRKDSLKKNINATRALGGRWGHQFDDIVPASFQLPQEYVGFVHAFRKRAETTSQNIWILKPVALSRGRGISLINRIEDLVYGEPMIIQEYIENPLLWDGKKVDLRLYVLVTSFNPLEAFLYKEGFVRKCTHNYYGSKLNGDLSSNTDINLHDLYMHLTNASIQKYNQDEDSTAAGEAERSEGGTKLLLSTLWDRLRGLGVDVSGIEESIVRLVVKSLLCGEDYIPFQVNSFDLLGYDILLDACLKPWLIEINSSPSLARENKLDYLVKDALVLDTIKLVDPLRFDRYSLINVLRRRLNELEELKKRPYARLQLSDENDRLRMNEDLHLILRGHTPRIYGELPKHLGNYQRICPSTAVFNQLSKLKQTSRRKSGN